VPFHGRIIGPRALCWSGRTDARRCTDFDIAAAADAAGLAIKIAQLALGD
jgi:hypothetical protein